MDQCSLRVYALNALTLIISLTNLEAKLKILLLLISIIYTSMKIYDWVLNKRKGKTPEQEENDDKRSDN
jgi:hypothetical protein